MKRAIALCMLFAVPGLAQDINIPKPGDREFLVDRAYMMSPSDKDQVTAVCGQCLKDRAIPIVVVTVSSIGEHAADNPSIETFARRLFNQWEIGYRVVNGASWNRGILFVVSRADRKARIELGRDWARGYKSVCTSIMDGQIIPKFRQGDYSSGIVAGVAELDAMARGLNRPQGMLSRLGLTWSSMPTANVVFFFVFMLIIVIAGIRNYFWPPPKPGEPGYRRPSCYDDPYQRHGYYGSSFGSSASSDSASFSGGSFGGGSSGGGGATGSW